VLPRIWTLEMGSEVPRGPSSTPLGRGGGGTFEAIGVDREMGHLMELSVKSPGCPPSLVGHEIDQYII
jgi:hypothetical protein